MNDTNVSSCNASYLSKIILVVSFLLLGIVGVFGNFLIFFVVWKNKPMRNPTNFLLTNVAISDLIFLLTSTPSYTVTMMARKILTYPQRMRFLKLMNHFPTIYLLPSTSSTITVTLLAIERYNALVHPMKIHRRLNKRGAKIVIGIIWFISLVVSFPLSIEYEFTRSRSHFYSLILFTTYSVFPAVTTAFCYSKILIGIYVIKNICCQSNERSRDTKEKKNLVKILITVTVILMISKLPVCFYYAANSFGRASDFTCWIAVTFLNDLSPCLNPVVYIAFCSNYREGVKRLLRNLWRTRA